MINNPYSREKDPDKFSLAVLLRGLEYHYSRTPASLDNLLSEAITKFQSGKNIAMRLGSLLPLTEEVVDEYGHKLPLGFYKLELALKRIPFNDESRTKS